MGVLAQIRFAAVVAGPPHSPGTFLFSFKVYLHMRFHSPILKYDVIWTGKNRAKIAIIPIKNDRSLSAFKQRN